MCMQKSIPSSLDVCVCVCQCEEHPETSQKETPEGCARFRPGPERSAMCNASLQRPPSRKAGLLTHTRGQTYGITPVLIKAFNSG